MPTIILSGGFEPISFAILFTKSQIAGCSDDKSCCPIWVWVNYLVREKIDPIICKAPTPAPKPIAPIKK